MIAFIYVKAFVDLLSQTLDETFVMRIFGVQRLDPFFVRLRCFDVGWASRSSPERVGLQLRSEPLKSNLKLLLGLFGLEETPAKRGRGCHVLPQRRRAVGASGAA